MPYALRDHICPDCQVHHKRRGPASPPMPCHPCSIARSAEAARQMAAKEGPYWDRYVWAYALAVRRQASELPRAIGIRVALPGCYRNPQGSTPLGVFACQGLFLPNQLFWYLC